MNGLRSSSGKSPKTGSIEGFLGSSSFDFHVKSTELVFPFLQ